MDDGVCAAKDSSVIIICLLGCWQEVRSTYSLWVLSHSHELLSSIYIFVNAVHKDIIIQGGLKKQPFYNLSLRSINLLKAKTYAREKYLIVHCSFVSISLGLVLASWCSQSLPDQLITVADEVCPLLSDCLPLAGMSCAERLSRVFHSFRHSFAWLHQIRKNRTILNVHHHSQTIIWLVFIPIRHLDVICRHKTSWCSFAVCFHAFPTKLVINDSSSPNKENKGSINSYHQFTSYFIF